MPVYLLRAAGQNFAAFLDDTQDLSTIRGASVALLNGITTLKEIGAGVLEAISEGASAGLYRFEAGSDAEAAAIAELARQHLGGSGSSDLSRALRHGTFIVAVEPMSGRGAAGVDVRLKARLRRAQMAEATVVYPVPEVVPETPGERVCTTDLVRPALAASKTRTPRAPRPVSRSVWDRRGYGLAAKQDLYRRLLTASGDAAAAAVWKKVEQAISGSAPFAFQLSSISEGKRPGLRTGLQDKICVLYADGTGFGDLQRAYLNAEICPPDPGWPADRLQRQKAFDTLLSGWRRTLLARLLGFLLDQGATGAPSEEESILRNELGVADQVIRIETLLWGGDEQLFVLPARLGWRAAELFLDATRDWQLGGVRLHHGVGMVFCHDDAPISRIRALARDLAEQAKTVSRTETVLLPVVLESFDHIGGEPGLYFERRTPRRLVTAKPAEPFVLRAPHIAALRQVAERIVVHNAAGEQAISRRSLRRAVQALHAEARLGNATKVNESLDDLRHRAAACVDPALLDTLRDDPAHHDNPSDRFWMLLEEFWDYLTPEDQS